MKKIRKKDEFLEELRKIPIVQIACERSALSRNTVYRWRKEDEAFAKSMAEALVEGEELINDMSESQLLSMIKDKNWPAISFWLRHRNPKFRERVEITTTLKPPDDKLNPEQEQLVREALRLVSLTENKTVETIKTQTNEQQSNTPTGNGGPDDSRQESKDSDNEAKPSNVL